MSAGQAGVGGGQPPRPHEEEITLWSFAIVLMRQRMLAFGIPVAAALLVMAGSVFSRRQYVAEGSFLPQEQTSAQSNLGSLATQLGLTAPRSGVGPDFYAALLQSREVLRQVVVTTYVVAGARPATGDLTQYFHADAAPPAKALTASIDRLRRSLTIHTDRQTGIVQFEVYSPYPDLSVQVVNAFLRSVSDFNLARRQSQARAEREFVAERLSEAQAGLRAAEDTLSEFSRRNRRIADSPELVAVEARIQRQVALRQQLYVGLAQSLEAAKIEEVRNTPVITVMEHPEQFVDVRPRRTLAKGLAALFLGGFVGLSLAFAREVLARARRSHLQEYGEFTALWREWRAQVSRATWLPGVRR